MVQFHELLSIEYQYTTTTTFATTTTTTTTTTITTTPTNMKMMMMMIIIIYTGLYKLKTSFDHGPLCWGYVVTPADPNRMLVMLMS